MRNNVNLGMANHNPLNIRYHAANHWLGLDAKCPQVKGFCRFHADVYGYRAAIKLVVNYMQRYGLTTPRAIISRCAPPSENNTALYVAAVCGRARLKPDAPINAQGAEVAALVSAMARQETGMHITPEALQELRQRFGV